jgi:mevalonate kinase
MLRGDDVAAIETAAGCGWQDHAVIQETGLCVWASGATPELVHQDSGEWLRGLMAIRWTGKSHCTSKIVDLPRDYEAIARAAIHAFKAVQRQSVHELAEAIDMTAEEQYREGMDDLPLWGLAAKYCGAGHGGYAMYLFDEQEQRDRAVSEKDMVAVEPYFKPKEVTK